MLKNNPGWPSGGRQEKQKPGFEAFLMRRASVLITEAYFEKVI